MDAAHRIDRVERARPKPEHEDSDISILGRLNRSRNRPGRRVRCDGHSLLVLHTAAAQGGAQAVKRRDEVAVGVDVPLASVVDRSSN